MMRNLLALCLDPVSMSGAHCQLEGYCIIVNNSCCYLPKSQYADLSRTAIEWKSETGNKRILQPLASDTKS